MLTVYKYPINYGVTKLQLPQKAEVLSVQKQNAGLYLWAKGSTLLPSEEREFIIYGTGHPIDERLYLCYIATVQEDHLVWHVFEIVGRR